MSDVDESQGLESGNPAWQPFLDILPAELHPLVVPTLKDWDQGVQKKLQDLHETYNPYKELVDNKIDPDLVSKALYLADQLDTNPEDVIKQAIEHYGLDYVQKALAQPVPPVGNDDDDFDLDSLGGDITQHPQYKALNEQVLKIQESLDKNASESKQQQEEREFEELLGNLQEKNKDKGEFDRLYVSALVANGVEADKAVESYYKTIADAVAKATGGKAPEVPPVVMGGDGVTGSGLPDQSVTMGKLSNSQVQDMVVEMLKKQSQT